MIGNTLNLGKAVLLLCAATLAMATPKATQCVANYGSVVVFEQCNPVQLSGVEVRLVGISQPFQDIAMTCWNYAAKLVGSEKKANFKQCTTGELGGHANFSAGGKTFTVVFDVADGCKQQRRGPAFYKGILDAAILEEMTRQQERLEADCFAGKSLD